jgi:aryl-alcohol dehydrogenase-like predicted oxidoreductase
VVRYRKLGSSDLQVSEISLGSWLTYGGGVERAQAEACVAKAFEVGINFIDTANVYARGGAESLLGEVLAGRPRGSYVLATKLYFPMNGDRGLSREQVHKQIDLSLGRLRTDYVDLYQCHRYDRDTPLEETMEALTEVVRAGKARSIGFSEWTAEQIQAALDLVPRMEKFVSSQPQYSLLYRVPEAEVIPLCKESGISQIVWSPLAQGALTGKYAPGEAPPPGTRAASREMGWAMDRFRDDDVLEAVQRLRPIADGLGITMAQLALAWVLRESNVASAIVGASRPEQVEENAAASGIELDDATVQAIDEALGAAARAYALGAPLFASLAREADAGGIAALSSLARDLERARDLGRGSLVVLRDVRDELRAAERSRALDAASRVEGRLMLVLVLCYLPALMLLVVIPLFLGLLEGLFI